MQQWQSIMPNTIQAGEPISGHGSPEGIVPGPVGKIYTDTDSGDVYQKEKGPGSTYGWVKRGYSAQGSGVVGTTGQLPFYTTAQRDATTPSANYAACFLIDSDPQFQLSIWANGEWH